MHHINSCSAKFCRLTLPIPFSLAFSLLWCLIFCPFVLRILLPDSAYCRDPNGAPELAAIHPSHAALPDAVTGSAAGKGLPKQALTLLGKLKGLKIKNLEEVKN